MSVTKVRIEKLTKEQAIEISNRAKKVWSEDECAPDAESIYIAFERLYKADFHNTILTSFDLEDCILRFHKGGIITQIGPPQCGWTEIRITDEMDDEIVTTSNPEEKDCTIDHLLKDIKVEFLLRHPSVLIKYEGLEDGSHTYTAYDMANILTAKGIGHTKGSAITGLLLALLAVKRVNVGNYRPNSS